MTTQYERVAQAAIEACAKRLVHFDIPTEVSEYEFRGDDEGGCYTPNEQECALMTDFAYGMLNSIIDKIRSPEFLASIVATLPKDEPVEWSIHKDEEGYSWLSVKAPKSIQIVIEDTSKAAPPAPPEGYVLVPLEPDQTMLDAGYVAFLKYGWSKEIWRRMAGAVYGGMK